MDILKCLFASDFIQQLFVTSIIFLFFLNKRSSGRKAGVAAAALGWLVWSCVLSPLNTPILAQFIHTGEAGFFLLYSVFYLGIPILATILFLYLMADVSWSDALYGTGMVYIVQHLGFCALMLFDIDSKENLLQFTLAWIVYLAVTVPISVAVGKRLPEDGAYHVTPAKAWINFLMVLLLVMALNWLVRQLVSVNPVFFRACLVYDGFCCTFILLVQLQQRKELELQASVLAEKRLRIQMREQYELSRENIDIINRKSHDLKHQIGLLRRLSGTREREELLDDLEREVNIYDSIFRTGNQALDIVLTEKGLLCRENGIILTCMAQGELLEFMKTADLYTLFGNAMDNAIEACRKVEKENRVITLTVSKRFGMITVECTNYYDGNLRCEDGKILTIKKNQEDHGFGLASMEALVTCYGGEMEIRAEENEFCLTLLFPRTEAV